MKLVRVKKPGNIRPNFKAKKFEGMLLNFIKSESKAIMIKDFNKHYKSPKSMKNSFKSIIKTLNLDNKLHVKVINKNVFVIKNS